MGHRGLSHHVCWASQLSLPLQPAPMTNPFWLSRVQGQWEQGWGLILNQVVPHKTDCSRSRQKVAEWGKRRLKRNCVRNCRQHKCVREATTSEKGAFLWQLKCFLIAHSQRVWCNNHNNQAFFCFLSSNEKFPQSLSGWISCDTRGRLEALVCIWSVLVLFL